MRCINIMLFSALFCSMITAAEPSADFTVTNNSGVDWPADTEYAVVPLGKILSPAILKNIPPAGVTLKQGDRTIPCQIDDLNFSGKADADDELVFKIPSPLTRGSSARFYLSYSASSPAEENKRQAFAVRNIGNFVKADCDLYTAVITRDTGTLNAVYMTAPERIMLAKSVQHSPLYSFVGGFFSPESGKNAWHDRLISFQFSGKMRPVINGPIRTVLTFDNIVLREKNAKLDFDDSYSMRYFLYPDGRIITRLAINPGAKKDSVYQMIFLHLALPLPQETAFNRLESGDRNGDVLEKLDIPPSGDFSYQRPLDSVLSFIGVAGKREKTGYGASLIVNPESFMFTRNVKNNADSSGAWNYIKDYRRAQSLTRARLWSGEECNIGMCASEWPGALYAPGNNIGLDSCTYVWRDANRTVYFAKSMRDGAMCERSFNAINNTK